MNKKHSIGENYFSHVVCLLAFHYYLDTANKLNNALEFISLCMKPGAKLGIILFDGSKILDLMDGNNKTTQ